LVAAFGVDSGISKLEVSRIYASLDEQVEAFRSRPLRHTGFPYVCLDATYLHVRHTRHVASIAVVATGVTAADGLEVLGLDVGDSEDEVFWRVPPHPPATRLVRSAAGHVRPTLRSGRRVGPDVRRRGASTMPVHFTRNLLALVPKSHRTWSRRCRAPSSPSRGAAQSWDAVRDQLAAGFP
jgi:putative transposase